MPYVGSAIPNTQTSLTSLIISSSFISSKCKYKFSNSVLSPKNPRTNLNKIGDKNISVCFFIRGLIKPNQPNRTNQIKKKHLRPNQTKLISLQFGQFSHHLVGILYRHALVLKKRLNFFPLLRCLEKGNRTSPSILLPPPFQATRAFMSRQIWCSAQCGPSRATLLTISRCFSPSTSQPSSDPSSPSSYF